MTVGELKAMLGSFDDDARVVFKPQNSMYVEDFDEFGSGEIMEVNSFWGKNFDAVVLSSGEQCGAV